MCFFPAMLPSCWPGFLALCCLAAPAGAASFRVGGVVFDDRNANGLRDAGEPGLAGVGVSDGVTVALTGDDGRYELTVEPAAAGAEATVFVIKPRHWRPPVDARNLPRFHRRAAAADGGIDFPLTRREEPDAFRALVFADPQVDSLRQVDYLARSLVAGLEGARDFAFGVTLGDIVNDRPELFGPVNEVMGRVGIPWYNINGNHDLDPGAGDAGRASTRTFEATYGPATYAFHYGRALFVALDNVRPQGGPRVIGGLREDQFLFLENLLRATPRDELVVLMMHIPWFYPDPSRSETFRSADRARLFALLEDRPHHLWLSGHTHYQRHVFYGPADGWKGANPLHEYNVAAAGGSFWTGPLDAGGLPLATMWDGTPPGYAELTFDGVEVRADYRPARRPAESQIGLHAPAVARRGAGYVSFYANVFNGHDGWTVEARAGGRDWRPLLRVLAWDPAYAQLFLAQNETPAVPAEPRLPDPVICHHLWRGYLPADLPAGVHALEVRAIDPAGRTFTATREVRVAEPEP
ncbi:calcineurin phosphoesterase [Opitutaceae bacterium TAV5]|nr:calcineurin phosphoesterase [Opitutaceae bacterium TAV5]